MAVGKKIPIDVYEAAGYGPVVVDMDYSNLDYASGDLTDTFDILTIPTDAVIRNVSWKLVESFDDSTATLTALTMETGDVTQGGGDPDGFTIARSVAADNTPISSDSNSGALIDDEGEKHYDQATTDTLRATFRITPSTGAASELNAGKIRFWVDILDLS